MVSHIIVIVFVGNYRSDTGGINQKPNTLFSLHTLTATVIGILENMAMGKL